VPGNWPAAESVPPAANPADLPPTQQLPHQQVPHQQLPHQQIAQQPAYTDPTIAQPAFGAPAGVDVTAANPQSTYGVAGNPAPAGYGAPVAYGSPAGYGPQAPYGVPTTGYPVAAPPKKRRGLIIGLIVAALVLVCGGAAAIAGLAIANKDKNNGSSATSPIPTSTGAASTSSSPTAATGPDHSGDLRRFLIPLPKGADSVKHPLGSKNSFTAVQESKDWDDSDGRVSMLSVHGFDAGAVRQWESINSLNEVELFRFDNANGALLFMDGDVSGGTDYFDNPATQVSVKNVPGGVLFYTKKKDKDRNTHAFASANCGDVTIEIWIDTYGTISVDYVSIMLRKQYAKVCP
jgi:hypothetical protein